MESPLDAHLCHHLLSGGGFRYRSVRAEIITEMLGNGTWWVVEA